MSLPYEGDSTSQTVPGIKGTNNASGGVGVFGTGAGTGIAGSSATGDGTRGDTQAAANNGVVGTNASTTQPPAGVVGGNGVYGFSENPNASGMYGNGVGSGVAGFSETGTGVNGTSTNGVGISVSTGSASQSAVFGINNAPGPVPSGLTYPAGGGVWGHTKVQNGSGVIGSVDPNLTQAAGVTGIGNPLAGQFFGNVVVTGDITPSGSDFAEDFDIHGSDQVEPGTVMVIDDTGGLTPSSRAYDKRVAGVISGAGEFRAGVILGRQEVNANRLPVALVGRVFCKVDADLSPIEVGDLLSTSDTPGPFRTGVVAGAKTPQ
jgi:hypothetical protein